MRSACQVTDKKNTENKKSAASERHTAASSLTDKKE
jgi:hypothetical protein